MSILSFYRIAKLGIQSFLRNRLLSVAAVLVMTITLLIIYIFVILNMVVGTAVTDLQNKIDLAVYFKKNVPAADVQVLRSRLSQESSVKNITFISEDDALNRYLAKNANDPAKLKIPELIGGNPLPASLEIKVDPPSEISHIVDIIHGQEYQSLLADQQTDNYGKDKETIDKLLAFTHFLRTAGIAASAFFIIVSFLVVFNTVKLTTFTRRDEIEIMRLVGATESFVRLPFVFEGMLYAIFGTITATALLSVALHTFSNAGPRIGPLLSEYARQSALFVDANMLVIFAGGLAIAIAISGSCSYLAVRRSL